MAARILALGAKSATSKPLVQIGAAGCHHGHHHWDHRVVIGNREVVGYGLNGQPNYCDRSDFPMPSLRWKENTPDIVALREKEKGDWRQLSTAEKKALYRSSFRQTFSEFNAPTGEWKSIIGLGLFFVSLGVWCYMGMKTFVYNPLPESFSEESQRAQLRRMLDMQVNPITGLSSEWDYEKNDWKK